MKAGMAGAREDRGHGPSGADLGAFPIRSSRQPVEMHSSRRSYLRRWKRTSPLGSRSVR